jgi:hypothetical protein
MFFDGTVFVSGPASFRVTFPSDDMQSPPWELHDGHGPVSEWTTRAKRPGEIILSQDRSSRRYYDFAEAVKIAKRDGWDAPPYKQGTRGEQAVRAVRADFKYLRGWANDEWTYVGVVVELLDANGEGTGKRQSVWGIESEADDYLEETARELASELLYDEAAHMKALAATLGVPYPFAQEPAQ